MGPAAMKEITRAIRPEDLQDLLDHPPRATLAFVRDGAVEALPVAFRLVEGRYCFGVPAGAAPLPAKAKLLIDDGHWYFDLHGVWMRGPVTPCAAPPGGALTGLDWYKLAAEKSVAWDYGAMRTR